MSATRAAWLAVLLATSVGCGGLARWAITPSGPFEAYEPPPAPDYALDSSWAALPGVASAATDVPPGLAPVPDPPADVFFLHPTTYFGRGGWNGPVDGCLSRYIVAHAILAGQASAFNAAGRIFAPRYRQMTLAGFVEPSVRERALDLAYSDVRRAFEHYLRHWDEGRPLILAGHSQGSRLLLRLLADAFADGPLRERLVAAYPAGARVGRTTPVVPVCTDTEQTGCLVAWRTFAEDADVGIGLDETPGEVWDDALVCVNPLTWRDDDVAAPPAANRGSIPIPYVGGPARPEVGLTGARCADGVLRIDPEPTGWRFGLAHPDGNWHAYDYGLFYVNVRDNARRRVDAFVRAREGASDAHPGD